MQQPIEVFDWHRILIKELPWTFLGEVAFRTVFMFIILLTALTVSGKREVRQLSIYELVLVIGLGSAAGDPMFYDDVPLSSAVVVFVVMMACYKLVTYISDHYGKVRNVLEGTPVYIVEDGRVLIDNLKSEDITREELFADLRVQGIRQLGQVQTTILEPNGQISVFPFKEGAVLDGLSIMPRLLDARTERLTTPGTYACYTCGHVERFDQPVDAPVCRHCGQTKWCMTVRDT
ncbi:uncharacterized membrane protein YcaP (DUF421 family) [Spirosoma oryzae]|uniref:Uncharacterized membrane protein YcaP (DUF421 family) n=1 Tax=Spirosoma oryzae TaxID=1469603 RepID=A0A2T0S476_9BACT|nr:YetF domain-containing protein [Spirosoma oryzae]PRY28192.1 uncharacterized membrane protein YcaP (DUF421 family) [Spirosoma oryzae]